ncbi:hypothetical protein EDC90_10091, partial [Martelella mediterranea]
MRFRFVEEQRDLVPIAQDFFRFHAEVCNRFARRDARILSDT